MWVFDGEQWVKEGGESAPKVDAPVARPEDEGLVPELQIVEIPVIRRERHPHVPFTIP